MVERELHAQMRADETQPLIKVVGPITGFIAGEFNKPAMIGSRTLNCIKAQSLADAATPLICRDPDGLDLRPAHSLPG